MKISKIFLIGVEEVVNEVPYTSLAIKFKIDKSYYMSIDLLQHGKSTINAVINKYGVHARGEGLENLLFEKLKERE